MTQTPSEEAQSREIRNRRNFSFRLNVFFFMTFFVFSVLIVRLAVLQFVEGPAMQERKESIGTRPVSIPPIRGNIYDSEGRPIAYSTSTQSLYYTIEPGTKEEEGRALAAKIAEVFNRYGDPDQPPVTAEDVFAHMDFGNKVHFSYQQRRLKSGLSEREIAYFLEHRDEFKGIDIVEESIRQYSPDRVAVQLVGYMKKLKGAKDLDFYKNINEGQTDPTLEYLDDEEVGFNGLELMYQVELRGRNGLKTYPVDNRSRIIGPAEVTKPVKGNNLVLTIDREVQLATQQAIMEHLEKIRTSSNRSERAPYAITGYAVAMEVDTGRVVAMASMPDYDPNVWQGGISPEEWEEVQLFIENGTIRQVYPPYEDPQERSQHPSSLVPLGSTIKPLTVLIGLNEGVIGPGTVWNDPGYFQFGRKGHETRVRNARGAVNGRLSPARAIAKSSNAFMAMVGNELYFKYGREAIEVWDRYMKQFGLGVTTGSGLPGESAGIIDYFNEAEKGSTQSAMIFASFGQQGRYTALQLAQYAATLANRGERVKPQFVERITDADGNVVWEFEKEVLNTVEMPEKYWEVIEEGMSQVPVQGFEGVTYTFRRKTGTSQQSVGRRGLVDNAVFIAYAPAEKPKLAVAVVVPDGGFGAWGAAPIARKIFDAYDAEIGLYGKPAKSSAGTSDAGANLSDAPARAGE